MSDTKTKSNFPQHETCRRLGCMSLVDLICPVECRWLVETEQELFVTEFDDECDRDVLS